MIELALVSFILMVMCWLFSFDKISAFILLIWFSGGVIFFVCWLALQIFRMLGANI